MSKPKICPLQMVGTFFVQSGTYKTADIECIEEQCAWYDTVCKKDSRSSQEKDD